MQTETPDADKDKVNAKMKKGTPEYDDEKGLNERLIKIYRGYMIWKNTGDSKPDLTIKYDITKSVVMDKHFSHFSQNNYLRQACERVMREWHDETPTKQELKLALVYQIWWIMAYTRDDDDQSYLQKEEIEQMQTTMDNLDTLKKKDLVKALKQNITIGGRYAVDPF